MTRAGIERARFLAFVQMTENGATSDEALAYCDLVHPFDDDKEETDAR